MSGISIEPKSEDKYSVEYHVVCIIDLLGQSKHLSKWSSFPNGDKDKAETFNEGLRDSVDTVEYFRDMFAEFFNAIKKSYVSKEDMSSLTPEQKAKYYRLKDFSLSIEQFSDTFIFHAPIKNTHGDITPYPIYSMISAAASGMMISLAKKTALRGAITIGLGTKLDAKDFYGPALALAHHLESKRAQYPRIIVAKPIIDFIQQDQRRSPDKEINQILSKMTGELLPQIITLDVDGHWIVDFLSPFFNQVTKSESYNPKEIARSAYEFVTNEVNRFQATDSNGLLFERYSRLKNHMTPRMELWQ